VLPGALSLLVLRGLAARLSHLPKSETECDVTPPGGSWLFGFLGITFAGWVGYLIAGFEAGVALI
jgi:hypothetical protein